MSTMGHEQTSRLVRVMSVVPQKADIRQRRLHVRLVPIGDHSPAASGSTARRVRRTAYIVRGRRYGTAARGRCR